MDTQAVTIFQETVKYSGRYIFIKPICDFFMIDYKHQLRLINDNINLQKRSSLKSDKNIFGDERERLCLTKRAFLFWIVQINSNVLEEKLRDKFDSFKDILFDFLIGSEMDEEIRENKILKRDELKNNITKTLEELRQMRNELKTIEKELAPSIQPKYIQLNLFEGV
jgi:hypothetical protein